MEQPDSAARAAPAGDDLVLTVTVEVGRQQGMSFLE